MSTWDRKREQHKALESIYTVINIRHSGIYLLLNFIYIYIYFNILHIFILTKLTTNNNNNNWQQQQLLIHLYTSPLLVLAYSPYWCTLEVEPVLQRVLQLINESPHM